MATLSCPTSPGLVKPSSHIQPLHSLLQLSFMSTDCSHEGKIGKGSKVSEFDEWNRIRHCRSACSLTLWVCVDLVCSLGTFPSFPPLAQKMAATTLEQSDLLIKVSASNRTSYNFIFLAFCVESYVQSFSPPSAKQPDSISLSGFGDMFSGAHIIPLRTPACLSDMAPSSKGSCRCTASM